MKTDEDILREAKRNQFNKEQLKIIDNLLKQREQAEQKRILKIIDKWWKNDKTCSGRPHCCVEYCDLCGNCYNELIKEVEKNG